MPSTPDRALAEIKEMAAAVPEKRRAPGNSKSGDGTPEDPQGAGRRRGGGDSGRGIPGSSHLAAAFSALGRARPPPAGAGLGSPLLREARPPEAAGGSPELTCRRARAAAACQSNASFAAPRRVVGPSQPRPASFPSTAQWERSTPSVGAWPTDPARVGAEPVGFGAGQGGACALRTPLRAGSIPGHGAAAQRLGRGAGRTMPVTGKTFRRRRADSESEEDEQDSQEVRCVWGGVPTEKRRAWGLATGLTPR